MPKVKKPIRVLQVLLGLGTGGAENWARNLVRYIDADRFKVDFLVHNERREYAEDVLAKGGRIIFCPYSYNPWVYARNFKNYLRQYGPYDVVHSHLASAGFHLWWTSQAGVPVRIAHCHTDNKSELASSSLRRRLALGISQLLVRRYATAGFAVSQQAASRFGANWSADPRWRVLYCGIELAPFRPRVDSNSLRRELGISEEALVVGHVGRIEYPKNHPFILEVIAKLAELHPHTLLLLVGDGPQRPELEKQANLLGLNGKVIFLGWRQDVPRLLKGAMDVFVLPSFFEGLPLVLMETQAAGLPAVITDTVTEETDVIKHLITRRSLNDSPSHWARAILSVYQGRSPTAQAEALEIMAGSRFNIERGASLLTTLYENFYQQALIANI
jgi:glycosyltransferase involved in cell wall biosynthesis